MTTNIRFTEHALTQLEKISIDEKSYILQKLEKLLEGSFSGIKIYLNSVQMKDQSDTYMLKMGQDLRLVYTDLKSENGDKILLVTTIFKINKSDL